MNVRVSVIASPDEWACFREIRLRALEEAPDAFGSTLEAEREADEERWRSWMTGWEGATNAVAVAEADDGWIGLAVGSRTGDEPHAHLYSMWVEPAWRRHGVGASLVEAVLGWARSVGCGAVVLGVTEGNDGAERFYRHLGFEDTGERHPLREGSERTVLVLRRNLERPSGGAALLP